MRFVWRSFQTVMLSTFFKLSALNAQKKSRDSARLCHWLVEVSV
jgi:hypothetical protein